MSEKEYQGGCHCGKVRYTLTLDLSNPVLTCNCSMCGRSGTMLAFVSASAFTLTQGEDNLTSYKFNKHVIDHLFCRTCGIKSFARGSGPNGPTAAINVRCLDDVDLKELKVSDFDGKNR
jgi:hypothetical protein